MTEKDMRLTVGQLKKKLEQYNVPDDAIVCCQSDEEGNRTMACCECYIEQVGHKNTEVYNGHKLVWVSGKDVDGLDMSKDNGRKFIIIRPLY